MSETLSLGRARSLWWERQGLGDDARAEDVARAIGVTGWLRSVSGADVYIAARARCPGMKRAELDAAVTRGDLRIIHTVRGSYLVPTRFVADLFALEAGAWRAQTETDLAKVHARFAVVEATAKAVLDALPSPQTTEALDEALTGAIPSFGDAGKQVGLSSPLPLALRFLELDGRIERTTSGGRLDSDRYVWRRAQWTVPAAAKTEAAQLANVVKAFLDFAGPSTLAHIARWSGRSERELAPVLAALGAEPVAIDGLGPAFAQRGDIDCAHEAMLPLGLRLLAFEDNYLVNHGGHAAVTDPKHHAIEILSRTIVVDGLVVGLWEVDPHARAAVWTTFDPQTPAVVSKIEAATAEMATFLLDDVGNCTVDVQDGLEGVKARADKIRALAGKQKTGRAA